MWVFASRQVNACNHLITLGINGDELVTGLNVCQDLMGNWVVTRVANLAFHINGVNLLIGMRVEDNDCIPKLVRDEEFAFIGRIGKPVGVVSTGHSCDNA